MTGAPRSLVPSASSSRPPVWTGRKISVYEAAIILEASKDTVQRMIDRGELVAHPVRPGGRKQLLWEQQVATIAARLEREAAERARFLSAQLQLDLF